jgi:hypothetical protein
MVDSTDYIPNDKLQEAIVNYQKTKKKEYYNKIGQGFIQISNKLVTSATFNRFPDHMKENMVGAAIYKMIEKLDNYDYEKFNNPFAYFTSTAFNVFRQHINKYYADIDRTVSLEQYLENNSLLPKDNKYADKMDMNRLRTNNSK